MKCEKWGRCKFYGWSGGDYCGGRIRGIELLFVMTFFGSSGFGDWWMDEARALVVWIYCFERFWVVMFWNRV